MSGSESDEMSGSESDEISESDYLTRVATTAHDLFERSMDMNYLHQAIWCYEECLEALPLGYTTRQSFLVELTKCLHNRYVELGDMTDLDQALLYCKELAEATSHEGPERASYFYDMSIWLGSRYDRMKDTDDFEEAILYSQKAVEAIPTGHPDRIRYLSELACNLGDRYDRTNDINGIQLAILYASEAVAETPADDLDRVGDRENLASWLHTSYVEKGDINHLHQAISYAEEVVEVMQDNPNRANNIHYLAKYLDSRYEAIGNVNDLYRSILYAREALASVPQNSLNRPKYLSGISVSLGRRFSRDGAANDLRQAILYGEEAVATAYRDDRSFYVYVLATLLTQRYDQTHNIDDLQRIILILEEAAAAKALDGDDPDLGVLEYLSSSLETRFDLTDDINDIRQVISYAEILVAAYPKGHPSWPASFIQLVSAKYRLNTYLIMQLKTPSRSILDALRVEMRRTMDMCYELWKDPNISPAGCMGVAVFVSLVTLADKDLSAMSYLDDGEWTTPEFTYNTYREGINYLTGNAIHLFRKVAPRSLGRRDQEDKLSNVHGAAPLGASWALEAGKPPCDVLELLELGRGLLMGFDIDCRADISNLEGINPALATQFCDLRRRVDTASLERVTTISERVESSFDQEVAYYQHQARVLSKRQTAIREMEEMLVEIRKIPGFERFQFPPSPDDLMAMAKDGPIVTFLSTACRSDAIIVTTSAISSLPLPDLIFEEIPDRLRLRAKNSSKKSKKPSKKSPMKVYAERNERMREQLLWLWNVAVEPVLRELKFTDPADTKLPHVWWIGVGELSMAPFHAAGDHSSNSSRNTISCVISSYTANIKALSYARERELDVITKPPADAHLLLVTMPKTPGEKDLPDVGAEVSEILKVTEGFVSTKHLESPSAGKVLENFGLYHAMHFACHGVSHARTSSHSHLVLLKDSGKRADRLTVQDISQNNTKSSQIAYLSACSTAQNSVLGLADETIHIASGFQLAGFSHVLGTLWASESGVCKEVAVDFYRSLFNGQDKGIGHRKVGMAFHEAVKRARGKDPLLPCRWAPFIHIGA